MVGPEGLGQLALDPIEESTGAAPEIVALLPANVLPEQACRFRRALPAEVAQRRKATHRTGAEQVALPHVLLAAHVRSNHVHLVVTGDAKPERMMTEFKAYATRALNRVDLGTANQTRWTRHGSTRWLDSDDAVARAVRYTVDEQGTPMAVYEANDAVSEPQVNGVH